MKLYSVMIAFLFVLGTSGVTGAGALTVPGAANDSVASADGNVDKAAKKKETKKDETKKEGNKSDAKKESK